ncbi:MAG: hypothetical protein SW019_04980 [Actinomycetota bacterium]|nr:hypothetical protein [Actinomycetota bacterium]
MSSAVTLGVTLVAGLLAQDGPQQTGPDFGKASPFGLIVVLLLLIGTFLLVWSMNRHLRRLPKSFGDSEDEAGGTDADGAAGAEPGGAAGSGPEGTNRDPG